MRHYLLLLCFALTAFTAQAEEWMVKRKISGNFADARDNVVMAIENRGLVINYISHMADMLARTGADLGATRKIYEQAEIIEFCSAGLSRKMMELDPHNIVLCPFAISIYTLPGEKDTTWVSYRQPKGNGAALAAALLEEIAAEAR
jgi:uncharacterized protein (DUF302 family)